MPKTAKRRVLVPHITVYFFLSHAKVRVHEGSRDRGILYAIFRVHEGSGCIVLLGTLRKSTPLYAGAKRDF